MVYARASSSLRMAGSEASVFHTLFNTRLHAVRSVKDALQEPEETNGQLELISMHKRVPRNCIDVVVRGCRSWEGLKEAFIFRRTQTSPRLLRLAPCHVFFCSISTTALSVRAVRESAKEAKCQAILKLFCEQMLPCVCVCVFFSFSSFLASACRLANTFRV